MLNNVTIMGRLVNGPELKVTNSGLKVTSFRLACDRDFNGSGEKKCDFFDIVAWRATAEFVVRNFTKGQPILITGRLQTRDWEDRDGNKRRAIEIIAENCYFAGGKAAEKPAEAKPVLVDMDEDDGDLPWDTEGDI